MYFIYLIIFISFYLDGIISNFISTNTNLLNPLLTLVTLIIIYPYFYNNEKKYYFICFLVGLLYDIVYTNTLGLNAMIFFIIAFFIKKINIFISNNSINVSLISIIIISLYRIMSFLILILIGYISFNFNMLIHSITSSLLLNIIYTIILYLIADNISRRKHIIKID